MATIGPDGPDPGPLSARPRQSTLGEDARQLALAVGQVVAVSQFRDRDRVAPHGLSPGQWYALRAVTKAGGLTVNQVAGALYVDKSTASRIAAGLVDRELMVREAEENDARTVWLAATPSGQALYATIRADEERDFAMLLEGLDAARRAELLAALSEFGRRLATSVEVVGGNCRVVR